MKKLLYTVLFVSLLTGCKTSKKVEITVDSTSIAKNKVETLIKKDVTTNNELTVNRDSIGYYKGIRIIFTKDTAGSGVPLKLYINDSVITSNKPISEVIKLTGSNSVTTDQKSLIKTVDESTIKTDSNSTRKVQLNTKNKEKSSITVDWKLYLIIGIIILIALLLLLYRFKLIR